MFVDKATVTLHAGNGGDGAVSFRHEKFIDKGGPDGGDGGKGGDIILEASRNENTLANFRYQRELKAEDGQPGSRRRRHGKSGENLVIKVPVGTVVVSNEDEMLADLSEDGAQVLIAKGGDGGFGNAHFTSSRRQAPRVAEKGERGDKLAVTFELKMIADVGLVGLPNAGKSTLLASISGARPEIADYPFTTLTPNLGVVDIDQKTSLLFADIPGLIAGASQGKGLGDEFLRHVERTIVLVHLIDCYEDVASAYKTIQQELAEYKVNLAKLPQVVVLNKTEGLDKKTFTKKMTELQGLVPAKTQLLAISAKSKEGINELLYTVKDMVKRERSKQARKIKLDENLPVLRLPDDETSWTVVKEGEDIFVVKGKKIERFARRTDFGSAYGTERLRDIIRKMGIARDLEKQGIKPNDTIKIGKHRFTW